MKNEYTIRPATIEDVLLFTIEHPPRTCRAWVVEENGEVIALAGVYNHSRKHALAFSYMAKDDIPKKTRYKYGKMLFEKIKGIGIPVFAHPDECLVGAARFLESLGFNKVSDAGGGVYLWVN